MIFCLPWRLQVVSAGFKEGKPRTEVVQNDGQQKRPFMQRLNEKRLKKCFFVLNIRQGTILLALLELIVLLFFCMMVTMVLLHVLQIEALIISEVEDSPARESIALSGLSGQEAIIAEVNNESRLQVGLHLAAYKVLGITVLLMFVLLHIVASGLLLIGAVTKRRGMLIMWLCTTTTDLSAIACATIVAGAELILKGKRYFGVGVEVGYFLILGFTSTVCLTHNILIVGSLYWELFEERKRGRSTNVVRNFHINIRPHWNTDLDRDVELLGDSGAVDNGGVLALDDAKLATERTNEVLDKPLIPDLLSDPSSELALPVQPELKLA